MDTTSLLVGAAIGTAGAAAFFLLQNKDKPEPPKSSSVSPNVAVPAQVQAPASVSVPVAAPPTSSRELTKTTLRTHTCGQLRIQDVGTKVVLCGWVQKSRVYSHFCFVDLRDRYGITQVVVHEDNQELYNLAKSLGREFVVKVVGKVVERSNKNKDRETGDIEIAPETLTVLNKANTPPFTIEDETDGNEDIRMKYRYLDLRRGPLRNNLILRHKTAICVRNYLSSLGFLEVETPVLIKSTPEGARDFLVPSRMNPGSFYALPQSPQQFKQLLMVAGMDKYFQIVKCFRDEELRADRQPEFTQIDCELSFVDMEDIIGTFEGLVCQIFKEIKGLTLSSPFRRMDYSEAMRYYGCDKPDLRFDLKFVELNGIIKGKGFNVFDKAETVIGFNATGLGEITKAKINLYTEKAKSPEIGAGGLVYVKYEADGKFRTSVPEKFYTQEEWKKIADAFNAKPGDFICIFAGADLATRTALGKFRLFMGDELKLRDPKEFSILWVVNFPLLEYDEEDKKWNACHHPFTSPVDDDVDKLFTAPEQVRAKAYDLVINGWEVGGGSIRIHNRDLQLQMFKRLGLTPERTEELFGFLLKAFEYGAPPHGGIAFGLDRLCALLGDAEMIRSFIAFPKNKEGRDTMIEAPSAVTEKQLKEVHIQTILPPPKEVPATLTTPTAAPAAQAPKKGKQPKAGAPAPASAPAPAEQPAASASKPAEPPVATPAPKKEKVEYSLVTMELIGGSPDTSIDDLRSTARQFFAQGGAELLGEGEVEDFVFGLKKLIVNFKITDKTEIGQLAEDFCVKYEDLCSQTQTLQFTRIDA